MTKKINARTKGNQFERAMVSKLRGLYPFAVTSRSESKSLDDRKVDICNTGRLRIQCKAVENLGSPHSVLREMDDAKLPHEKGMSVLFHKKNRQGITVSLWLDDFMEIIKHFE